jgi:predicted transcriptional regulator
MSTLTIDLPDDLAARLAVASEQKHVPPATIVREALERTLRAAPAEAPKGRTFRDALNEAGAMGCIDSGVSDLATNPKHLEGFGKWRA